MRARAATSAPSGSARTAIVATRRASGGGARLKRAAWFVHRVLGLGLGGLIVVSSLTGGLLVMHDNVERSVEPGRHVLPSDSTLASVQPRPPVASLVRAVANEAPAGYRPLRLVLAHAAGDTEQLLFVAPDGRTRWTAIVNPATGDLIWRGPDQALFTPWLLGLHMHLRLGGWGYVVTGVGGAALFLLGATGLYVYRQRFRGSWRRPMRLDRGWGVALGDLHRWVGVATIYFSLVLGVTGLIYTIRIAPGQIAAPKPLPAPFDLARLASVEPALAFARERFPGAELLRITFPNSATAPLTVLVLHRDAPVWRKFSRIDFEPATGAVRTVRDARTATPGEKFAAILAPLHFGFYGSPLVKWLYVVGGFSPAILAVSGMAIGVLRRRRASIAKAVPNAIPGGPTIQGVSEESVPT